MPQPLRRQRRLARRIRHRKVRRVITLITRPTVIILEQIILLRIQDVPIRRRALPYRINRHPDPLPVSEQAVVGTLQDDALHLVRVAEVAHVGLAAEVLDFLVDDCGCDVGVPALRRGEGFEVGGVRVEDVGALGAAGVRGVGLGEDY